jgi:hypothetical protein
MPKILVIVDNLNENSSSGAKANLALIHNLICPHFDIQVAHYTRKVLSPINCEVEPIHEQRWSIIFLLSKFQLFINRYLKINLNKYVESILGFSLTHIHDVRSIEAFLRKNIEKISPDLILTLSEASSFRPHKAMLSFKKYHTRWLAYVHDPYPMHSYPRPYDWVEPGHQRKRDFFLAVTVCAGHIGYPSFLLAEWMESYYPPAQGKSVIIPHQISDKQPLNPKMPAYFDKTKFNILHAGALMSARNPMSLVEAFILFLENNPEAMQSSRLVFLGSESIYTQDINRLSEKYPQIFYQAENIVFANVLSMQYATCVNVIIEAKGPISPFLPGKFAHCVQADKPILLLSPYYSESRSLLGSDYRFVAEIDDVISIQKHISTLYEAWKENGSKSYKLNRPDLLEYLGAASLHKIIKKLIV